MGGIAVVYLYEAPMITYRQVQACKVLVCKVTGVIEVARHDLPRFAQRGGVE